MRQLLLLPPVFLFLCLCLFLVHCKDDTTTKGSSIEIAAGDRSLRYEPDRQDSHSEYLDLTPNYEEEEWVQMARRRLDYIPNSHKYIIYKGVKGGSNENFTFANAKDEIACKATGDVIVVKKRIVLHLGQSGLGNRLLATVSAVVLSVIMDRVLVLDWGPNRGCAASYLDLFKAKPPNSHLLPLLNSQSHHEHVEGVQVRRGNKCYLNLDGHVDLKAHNGHKNRYAPFNVLKSPALFRQLDQECDVIDINSNLYFVHLLLNDKLDGEYRKYLHNKIFIRPFHNVVESIFHPRPEIQTKIDSVLQRLKGPKGDLKWLSIQARSKMMKGDDDTSLMSSLVCANYLLAKGVIDHVFFASDSEFFLKIVEQTIEKEHPGKLVTVRKKNLNQNSWSDNFAMRDSKADMEVAVVEWWLIGEADYCISPSIDDSTFSKTSIARGSCKFIDYWACVQCQYSALIYIHSLTKKDGPYKVPTEMMSKEHLLFMVKGMHRYEGDWLNPMIPYQTPEEAWAQVKIEKMKHYEKEQCLEPEEQLDKLHKTIQEYYVNPLDNKLEIQVMHTRHTNPRVAIQDPNL